MWDLVRFLPHDASLWRVLDPSREWSAESHLIAHLIDLTAIANWQRGGGKGRRPRPIERPGVKSEKTHIKLDRFATPAEFDAWRARQLDKTHQPKTPGPSKDVAVHEPHLARQGAR